MSGLLTAEPSPEERRQHRRYPLRLEVHFKVLHLGRVAHTGSGVTIDISTQGTRFETQIAVPSQREIVLELMWPALLDGVHRLKVVASGRILRSDENLVAVRFKRFEFRTAGRKRGK